MKAVLLLVAATVFVLASSFAAAGEIQPRAARLAERLSLDDEQTREISELMVAHREAVRERLESGEQPRGRELRDRLRESREQLHEQIREVLTPEQAEAFDQLGARAGRPVERRRDDRGAGERARPESRMTRSNLDAEKREEMRALRERQREEIRSLRARHRQQMQALMQDGGEEGTDEDESVESGDHSGEGEPDEG